MANEGVVDRVVIVTGGGGGIGRGLVRHLGSVGAKVVIAEINEDALDVAIKELEASGAECLGVKADVCVQGSIQAMVDATVERFGGVDGIVNNAFGGRTRSKSLIEHTEEDVDINIRGHLKATLWGMQAVYPHMKKAGWGRIVNVSSHAGQIGWRGMGAYGAAKEAVTALTRTAAREWARDGIVVNCYRPSSLTHHFREGQRIRAQRTRAEPDEYSAESMAVLKVLAPAGDMETRGNPETDLGPVVAFLLSDGCRYLTGQTLTLDGGAFAFA